MFSKRLTLAVVAFAGALTLAACGDDGGSPGVVATINGTDITATQVDEQFDILSQSSGEAPEGTTQEEYDRQLSVSGLNQLIFGQLLLDGAADLEIEVTDEDVDATRQELIVQYGGEDELYDQLDEQMGMDREEVDRQIEIQATQTAIIESLTTDITDEQVQTAYDDGASARHILVEDEATATDVLDRIDAGEDFAAIASEVSTDTGSAANGGELGFNQPGIFVTDFDDALFGASDGEVVGPVETSFGFHIIERLDKPAIADVEEQIRTQLEQLNSSAAEQEYGTLIEGWVQEAEVTIHDPEYGVWDAEGGLVVVDPEDSGETDDSGNPTPTPTPTDE